MCIRDSFAIVTDASAFVRALGGTIHKDAFTGGLIQTHHIRFAARLLHFIERPELGTVRLESCLYDSPLETCMSVHVRVEAGVQCLEQAVALLRGNRFRFGHLDSVLCAW